MDERARFLPTFLRQRDPHGIGGTHEHGLNAAIVKGVRAFMEAKKISVKVTIGSDDIR